MFGDIKIIKGNVATNTDIIQISIQEGFYEAIKQGEMAGMGSRLADLIAEKLLPEMEQRIFSDSAFKDRVIGDILVRIANRLADKGFLEKEEIKKD